MSFAKLEKNSVECRIARTTLVSGIAIGVDHKYL
jgi:hypothetical protein